jgi:TonB family protein
VQHPQNLEELSAVVASGNRLQAREPKERIDLVEVAEEKHEAGGLSLSGTVSFVLHAALILWFLNSYQPAATATRNAPMARYVELIKQNPNDEFVEAPGPAIDKAPINAPLSDANRRASIPEPTGDTPTRRPGDGGGIYTPPAGTPQPPQPRPTSPQQAPPQQAAQQHQQVTGEQAPPSERQPPPDDRFVYRETSATRATAASAAGGTVDWRSAIKEAAKVASLGGTEGLDLGGLTGGEKGFAEQGPLSFETAWFDWGPYAQSMVSRIRVNWYANMPQLIRTGIGGVVTIRFTIERDGRITELTVLKSSGHPPYDFAARKAIELSSPLNPLPKDFPNPNERVTAMFYYNTPIQ